MFPLSQPALCLDSRGWALRGLYCKAGSAGEKERSSKRRWGKADEWRRERGKGDRETEKLDFQKAIDRLPLKISYWISLTETAF